MLLTEIVAGDLVVIVIMLVIIISITEGNHVNCHENTPNEYRLIEFPLHSWLIKCHKVPAKMFGIIRVFDQLKCLYIYIYIY